MDRMIYTAMNGAKQLMLQQATNNHNLANISTTGFRADLDAFKALPVYGPGYASRVYSEDNRVGIDLSSGRIAYTGRDLDIAINGDGLIAVQAADGSEAYTRAGDLRISSTGLLQTGSGDFVLGNAGPISIPPFEKLSIGVDGSISIQALGQAASTLTVLDRIKLVNPETSFLEKRPDGLLGVKNGEPVAPDAMVTVSNGAVESSNVNGTEALINMIQLSRNFEMQIKFLRTAEEIDASSAKLLSMT